MLLIEQNVAIYRRDAENAERKVFSLAVERTSREKLYSPLGDWIIKG